jgi:hypothetical protein
MSNLLDGDEAYHEESEESHNGQPNPKRSKHHCPNSPNNISQHDDSATSPHAESRPRDRSLLPAQQLRTNLNDASNPPNSDPRTQDTTHTAATQRQNNNDERQDPEQGGEGSSEEENDAHHDFYPFLNTDQFTDMEDLKAEARMDCDALIVASSSIHKVLHTISPLGATYDMHSNINPLRGLDKGSRLYIKCNVDFKPQTKFGGTHASRVRLANMKNIVLTECILMYGEFGPDTNLCLPARPFSFFIHISFFNY